MRNNYFIAMLASSLLALAFTQSASADASNHLSPPPPPPSGMKVLVCHKPLMQFCHIASLEDGTSVLETHQSFGRNDVVLFGQGTPEFQAFSAAHKN